MARNPNTAIVLHPVNSPIITLDLCLQVDNNLDNNNNNNIWRKNMARDENEVASKTIERLQILLAQQKGEKNSKRMKREDILKNCEPIEVLGVESSEIKTSKEEDNTLTKEISLKTLNVSLPNKIFWKCAKQILIGSKIITVKYNVPTITSIIPPSALYVGLPCVCSGITVLFTSELNIRYEWCIQNNSNISVISTDSVFTPLEEHIGKNLILRVSPEANNNNNNNISDLWTQVQLPQVRPTLPPVDRWKLTSLPVESPMFRVVTYNVLHDEFCTSGSAKKRIYPFATDDILSLEYRQVRIIQELLAYHADIICLQECGKKVYQHFFERVLRFYGYEGNYTNKNGGVREGCASFWRSSRFNLEKLYEFPLNWKTLQEDHSELAIRISKHVEFKEALENITSIATILFLKDNKSNENIIIGNTHLFYHPNACHIRLIQAYILLYKLKNFSLLNYPIILCGDFNFTHTTGGYNLVTTGCTNSEHHSWKKGEIFHWGCDRQLGIDPEIELEGIPNTKEETNNNNNNKENANQIKEYKPPFEAFQETLVAPLQLTDAYGLMNTELPWTNYTMTFKEVIDYIFFNPTRLTLVQIIPIPPEKELAENVALPNKQYPSDHVALVADLMYKSISE